MTARPTIHANCVVIGEAGVLIRGPSGAGKSSFSEALIDAARACGLFARLVADDRVRLAALNGRLVARVPDRIAGLIERRGLGVAPTRHLAAAVVRLVVDLEAQPDRMPDADARSVVLDGLASPRVSVARDDAHAPALVLRRLASDFGVAGCGAFALALEGRTGGRKQPGVLAPH